jgi:hypothetical protein
MNNATQRPTRPMGPPIRGNYTFARAAYALGVDVMTARRLLAEALAMRQVAPPDTDHDALWAALPTLHTLMRRVLPDPIVNAAIGALRAHLSKD